MIALTKTTTRSIHYYELRFNAYKQFEGVERAYLNCFKEANKLVESKSQDRYLKKEGYTLFFGALKFLPGKKILQGQLFKVRDDILPRLINLKNEEISDLVIEEEQGLLETTHFLVDYRNVKKAQLSLEYNHYGARISDFIKYVSHLGSKTKTIRKAIPIPIVRDRLESLITRMNRVSKFEVKVQKDNIERIQKTDAGLATALHHAQNYSNSDYVTLDFKIDYQVKTNTSVLKKKILKLVEGILKKPEILENFQTLKIKAEDEENHNKIEIFDLITDKERSHLTVEKKDKTRTIISNLFFPKMIKEYERKFK